MIYTMQIKRNATKTGDTGWLALEDQQRPCGYECAEWRVRTKGLETTAHIPNCERSSVGGVARLQLFPVAQPRFPENNRLLFVSFDSDGARRCTKTGSGQTVKAKLGNDSAFSLTRLEHVY